MKYQNTDDKTIVSYGQLKAMYPETSLAPDGTELIMSVWHVISNAAKPQYDKATNKVIEVVPVDYTQTWEIVPLTQEELDNNDIAISGSMLENGETLTYSNLVREDVGTDPLIADKPAHDSWMQTLYNSETATPKPPATERQMLSIALEDADNYTFTRYNDTWGWRWYLSLQRPDVNALAISIHDAAGNYLYTTGGLIDDGAGGWYTECPAGQADPSPENVYYKWLMGSAPISDLESYDGSDEIKTGVVRSDPRYD